MARTPHAWPRVTRLKRRRLIRPLFAHGGIQSGISIGSVRLLFRTVPRHLTGSPVQVGFAVTRQRTAVRRNAIRRVLREAFRTSPQRAMLCMPSDQALTLMVLCHGNSATTKAMLRADLAQALDILVRRLTA